MEQGMKRASALEGRIAAGKADPITAEERAIVADLRAGFEEKYGGRRRPKRHTFRAVVANSRGAKTITTTSKSTATTRTTTGKSMPNG